jgi:LEA14-like dessication related protein
MPALRMLTRLGRPSAVLLLWSCALWIAACSLVAPKFAKPNLSVASIQLISGNLLQQNFLVKLNIQNPNDRALPVTSLHVELNVAGDRIASGVSNRAFVVPAHGDTQFDMTITANTALALLKLSQQSDPHSRSIDYDMTGGASIDLPFLRDLPFRQHGSFDSSK